ncbi:MAG: 30S ribosomal protein S3ae [Candidatus Aenigmatarchaeota archaeon]
MAKVEGVWKGKKWFDLRGPDIFKKKDLGETASSNPDELMGRTLSVRLTDLVSNTNKYFYKIILKINEVEDGKAKTKFIGHDCSKDAIYRMVRRGIRRIDSRDVVETKDGVKIVVKTIAISLKKVTSSIKSSIRKAVSDSVKKRVSKMTLEEFVNNMIKNNLQNKIRDDVSKTYPLRNLEVRKSEVLED